MGIDTQFHQGGAGGLLESVGDQLADHQLGEVPGARGHGQVMAGVGLVEEVDGAVAGSGDAAKHSSASPPA